MHRLLTVLAAFTLAAGLSGAALAAPPCKDPKTGRFIKCPPPPPPAVIVGKSCRDKTTKKFVKCGTPNSEPVTPATTGTH